MGLGRKRRFFVPTRAGANAFAFLKNRSLETRTRAAPRRERRASVPALWSRANYAATASRDSPVLAVAFAAFTPSAFLSSLGFGQARMA